MVDFAVHHEGIPEGSGRWVLAVDGDRLLLCDDDRRLYWRDVSECTVFGVHTPEQPTLVVPVQMPQQNGLVMPEPNRAMRRNETFGRN